VAERGRRGRRPALAVLLALGLLAGAALGATALVGCGEAADPLAGYWTDGAATPETLVQIDKDGDTYTVRANPDTPLGDAVLDGDDLVIETHAVTMRFAPDGADGLILKLGGSALTEERVMELERVDETGYADAAVAYGVAAIRRGLTMWVGGGGKKLPPPSEVAAGGALGSMVSPWPVNLFSGGPMRQGEAEGDFTYTVSDDGDDFTLAGHLSDGGTTTGE